jgi:hypothetical protein
MADGNRRYSGILGLGVTFMSSLRSQYGQLFQNALAKFAHTQVGIQSSFSVDLFIFQIFFLCCANQEILKQSLMIV